MDITPAVVRYAAKGLRLRNDGAVERRNCVLAKISRPEVAKRFLEPPPDFSWPHSCRAAPSPRRKRISPSGFPSPRTSRSNPIREATPTTVPSVRSSRPSPLSATRSPPRETTPHPSASARPAASTPASVASAFALGAAYVMTGTVNEAAVESGLSEAGRLLLAQAGIADVAMAPAADMFEMGVKGAGPPPRHHVRDPRPEAVRRLHGPRIRSRACPRACGRASRARSSKAPLDAIWADTRAFWSSATRTRSSARNKDPHHRMALCFRWYLGKASRWANAGEPTRMQTNQGMADNGKFT